MSIYNISVAAIVLWDLIILILVSGNLLMGKQTWGNQKVRAAVYVALLGFACEIIYSLSLLLNNAVPQEWPLWGLKDIGFGILFLFDVFTPQIYGQTSPQINWNRSHQILQSLMIGACLLFNGLMIVVYLTLWDMLYG